MGSLHNTFSTAKPARQPVEGTVWRAVDCFGVNWDIEDSDFPAMFADAMQQASRRWTTRPCSPSAACRT